MSPLQSNLINTLPNQSVMRRQTDEEMKGVPGEGLLMPTYTPTATVRRIASISSKEGTSVAGLSIKAIQCDSSSKRGSASWPCLWEHNRNAISPGICCHIFTGGDATGRSLSATFQNLAIRERLFQMVSVSFLRYLTPLITIPRSLQSWRSPPCYSRRRNDSHMKSKSLHLTTSCEHIAFCSSIIVTIRGRRQGNQSQP